LCDSNTCVRLRPIVWSGDQPRESKYSFIHSFKIHSLKSPQSISAKIAYPPQFAERQIGYEKLTVKFVQNQEKER
jgi:hypothetical protein